MGGGQADLARLLGRERVERHGRRRGPERVALEGLDLGWRKAVEVVGLLGGFGFFLQDIHGLVLFGRGLDTLDELGQSVVGVYEHVRLVARRRLEDGLKLLHGHGLVARWRLEDGPKLLHGGCSRYGLLGGCGLVARWRLEDGLKLLHGDCDGHGLLGGRADGDGPVLREEGGENEIYMVSI